MKIKVYPGPFCKAEVLDKDGFMEIEEGAKVSDVIKRLECSLYVKIFGLYLVNYKKAKPSTKLKEGDIISIIAPLAGG